MGNKVYGGQSSHLPLKLNMAGVIPPIFASSIILLPATVVNWFQCGRIHAWLRDIASTLTPGQPIYVLLLRLPSCFLLLLYGVGFQQPRNLNNLKKSGAFVSRDSTR